MLEKDIVTAILRYLRGLPGCFCWKEHGGQYSTAGIPDIIVCYRGRFVALEVKQPGGKLSALQSVTIRKIINAGGTAAVVTSLAEAKAIITELEAQPHDR